MIFPTMMINMMIHIKKIKNLKREKNFEVAVRKIEINGME